MSRRIGRRRKRTHNRVPRTRPQARYARHIHHRRAARQMRRHGAGDVVRPAQVRVHEPVKVRVGRLGDEQRRGVDARAVEDAVDAAMRPERVCHGHIALRAGANVEVESCVLVGVSEILEEDVHAFCIEVAE